MTANELADELIEVTGELWISRQCATMLRQMGLAESIIKQQKLEIDAWHNLVKEQDKKIIDLTFSKVYAERTKELAKSIEINDALNIADHLSRGQYDWCPEAEWVLKEQHDKIRFQQTEIDTYKLQIKSQVDTYKYKELTDKEILSLWNWNSGEILATDLLDFADAILRKARGDV
jgi:hypothetical protein